MIGLAGSPDMANGLISYDEVARQICENVDERIKFIAIAVPIIWMLGNWLHNKAIKRDWFSKEVIGHMYWPKWGAPWYEIEPVTPYMIVVDIAVPALRSMLVIAMGMMIYYTQISGSGF